MFKILPQFPDIEADIQFGRRSDSSTVQWETRLRHVPLSLHQLSGFFDNRAVKTEDGTMLTRATHWAYLSYKHMSELFRSRPADDPVFSSLNWSVLGINGDGRSSTLWVGTEGAGTQCHCDTYGCNVVAQLHGRKRWTLFPPSDTKCLYPTRVPYEESSIFSQVHIAQPNLVQHPDFALASPTSVVLEPGQVLFVPRHWWHHVECLEDAVSVNMWQQHALDGQARIDEGVVSMTKIAINSSSSHFNRCGCSCRFVWKQLAKTSQKTLEMCCMRG